MLRNSEEALKLCKQQDVRLNTIFDRLDRNDQTVQGIIMKLADLAADIEKLQKKKSLAKNKTS